MIRRVLRTLAALVVALAALWAAPVPAADAASTNGRILDFELVPPEQTFTVGDTITWTNEGERPHTVTDRGGLFDTKPILPGETATITLEIPGPYAIFCEINPSRMNADIVVEPGPTPPAAVRVQAFDEARDGERKRFDPDRLEVAPGTRLVMANVGGLRHSLVAEDGSFAIPVVEPGAEAGRFRGGSGSDVVTEPGEHVFFCDIHPQAMRGTLVVTGADVEAEERPPPDVDRPPRQANAQAKDFEFDATSTLVAPGGTVTWTNAGTKPHTATFDDVDLDTGRIEPAAETTVTAPGQPGTYSYRCTIHPQMRGVLVVSPEAPTGEAAAPSGGGSLAVQSGDTAGTVFAYVVAVAVVGVGVAGLVLSRRRTTP